MTAARVPFRHPAVWYSRDLRSKDDLAVDLAPRHLDALRRALEHLESRRLDLGRMRAEHFPLDPIAADVAAWRREVREGRGIVLLRGLPVAELGVERAGLLYFGLGLHFGRPVSQSNMGDLLGHVVDVGGKDRRERAYRNSRELHLHTDRCDHVAMLCIRPAAHGGVSGYASALAVHNEILAARPDLLEPLYAGYFLHRFGEQPPGEPPVTPMRIPVYSVTDGVPSVVYLRGYIDLAEQEGHCRLSDREREALEWFERTCDRPDVRLDFTLEPGEAAFFNNCLVLHTRTAFEDHLDAALRRHLLRLWLMEDGRPASAGERLHKGAGGVAAQAGRGTYYSGGRAAY